MPKTQERARLDCAAQLKFNFVEMKQFWQSLDKISFTNSLLAFLVIASIVLMFGLQFRVEALQDEMVKTENEIVAYEDEIQLLEVEWVYLTRPARLRSLASNYLQNNGYTLASQIKEVGKLEKYYLVNYRKAEEKQLALDSSNQDAQQVSF